jgi:hypothetical protein
VVAAETSAAISMFEDHPRDAVEAWRAQWHRIEEMGILAVAGFRLLTADSLVGALLAQPENRRDVRQAGRLTRSLRKLGWPHARAVHAKLRSHLAAHAGDTPAACRLLRAAADHYDEAAMSNHAAACRYRSAALGGAPSGPEAEAALAALAAAGVVDPRRWTQVIAPAIPPAGARRALVG